MKSGVLVWDEEKLLNSTMTIIVNSSPDLKVEALDLCTQIMENCIIREKVSDYNLTYMHI